MTQSSRDGERTLYGFWLSPYMALVAHVLTEAGLPYRYERVCPFVGETRADDHLTRNPLGKIPSLRDVDGVMLSESQAICRYLARTYDEARTFYPCDDPLRCAEVDRISDFLTFSVSGPFFNWFVVGAYWPQAWGAKTEKESEVFSTWSMVMNRLSLGRLTSGSVMSPFLLGEEPTLPDFHLFHILELGRTYADFFDMPALNLVAGDTSLQAFYGAMAARPSTAEILAAQEAERDQTRREIFEDFGKAYADMLTPAKAGLSALFGHEV